MVGFLPSSSLNKTRGRSGTKQNETKQKPPFKKTFTLQPHLKINPEKFMPTPKGQAQWATSCVGREPHTPHKEMLFSQREDCKKSYRFSTEVVPNDWDALKNAC